MINIEDIKPGDRVTIYATARGADSFGGFTVSISLQGRPLPMQVTVDPKEIATHEPATLKLGDKVTIRNFPTGDVYTIHGAFKERCWVVRDRDGYDFSANKRALVRA